MLNITKRQQIIISELFLFKKAIGRLVPSFELLVVFVSELTNIWRTPYMCAVSWKHGIKGLPVDLRETMWMLMV